MGHGLGSHRSAPPWGPGRHSHCSSQRPGSTISRPWVSASSAHRRSCLARTSCSRCCLRSACLSLETQRGRPPLKKGLRQQSPSFLTPGTGFMEDNFPTDRGWGAGCRGLRGMRGSGGDARPVPQQAVDQYWAAARGLGTTGLGSGTTGEASKLKPGHSQARGLRD